MLLYGVVLVAVSSMYLVFVDVFFVAGASSWCTFTVAGLQGYVMVCLRFRVSCDARGHKHP